MVITSKNEKQRFRRYGYSQFRLSLIYILITFLVLLFLNYYCSRKSRETIFQGKKENLVEKCLIAAEQISLQENITPDSVISVASKMNASKITRIVITDAAGSILYDSTSTNTHPPLHATIPSVEKALKGYDVFYWNYDRGKMCSQAAVPIFCYQELVGCVYVREEDPNQGFLIRSLQNDILIISVILEIVVILFTLFFSKIFSRRMRKILNSIHIIRGGDYNHKVNMGGSDEFTILGEEFNDLTDKLQISENKRHQFVSDASHELKTPLASIKLLTDSILQNPMDTQTTKEFVEDIGNEADRLNRMTQKLLTLTKSDTPYELPSEIIFMAPTISRVIRMLSALAAQDSIEITVDDKEDSPILILEDDLYQIAFNLVENGIKYNVPGGKLEIKLMRREDNAILEVKDTGVGISQEALKHIFERFYRVDKARSRKSGGSGLGLSIVRNMVERNSGKISVSSQPGSGTCFQVVFPVFDADMKL